MSVFSLVIEFDPKVSQSPLSPFSKGGLHTLFKLLVSKEKHYLFCQTVMIFSEPHLVKGDKDVSTKAQNEENIRNSECNHKVMACISYEPGSRQVQYNAHKRDTINRNL